MWLPHRFDLEQMWKDVKASQEEGLITKRVDGRYEHERSWDWLKIKNWRFDICNLVGYTPGKNARAHFFGSLVLSDAKKKFRGCAGSGPNDWELRQLKDIFEDLPKVDKPFEIGAPYTPVRTDLKVLVKYYKITEAGVMRFPVFVVAGDEAMLKKIKEAEEAKLVI